MKRVVEVLTLRSGKQFKFYVSYRNEPRKYSRVLEYIQYRLVNIAVCSTDATNRYADTIMGFE